jgi:oligopeptide/dipeptide ABC transporter ATP-binding protein
MARGMAPVLEIKDLHVAYRSREGVNHLALAGVSFELFPGETLGILGESGSGKSTLAGSLLRLLPPNAVVGRGAVNFAGKDLLQAGQEELRQIRGAHISLIFQEPLLALHPTMRVGEQVRQVLAAHGSHGKVWLKERTRKVFAEVFPDETDRILNSYTHQLSGGQRQRVLIAQAIACSPRIVIADEPTASLDSITQLEILGLFRELKEKLDLAMIFISHNPALLAAFADRLLVLYGGRVIEWGPAAAVSSFPRHPYTKALFASVPAVNDDVAGQGRKAIPVISGDSMVLPVLGCVFEPRCAERMETCKHHEPALLNLNETHKVACLKYEN